MRVNEVKRFLNLLSQLSILQDVLLFAQKPQDCVSQGTGVFQVSLSGERGQMNATANDQWDQNHFDLHVFGGFFQFKVK